MSIINIKISHYKLFQTCLPLSSQLCILISTKEIVLMSLFIVGILTPADEFQFWSEVAMTGQRTDVRERARHFQELFQPISKDYGSGLDCLSMQDVLELIEMTLDVLDDLWKQSEFEPPYPENRMKHLMDIIG